MPTLTIRRAARCAVVLVLTALASCAPAAAEPLGDSPAAARANTRDLFGALALRLGPLTRSERLARIRPRYVRGSLIPSRIFDDTTVWTAREGATRTLVIAGHPAPDDRYLLDVHSDAPLPQLVGDSRHIMHLRSLGAGVFEWRSTDELAVGDAPPAGIDAMRRRLLGAAEGRSGAELRALWQLGLPRTTSALGRLFAVDSVATVVFPDRSTSVALRISLDPERLHASFPDFAKWVEKYAGSSRYRMVLEDDGGAPYALVSASRGVVRVRMRTRDGILQPLAGPARAVAADSLRMRADVSSKVVMFTVGASDILADIVPVHGATERGWTIRYRHEPEWRFPFAVDHLMRDALRRPFSGEGTWTRLVARAEPGRGTVIARDFHMEVEESAIVRWLSALGNAAMSDVTARVEQQKDRFFADAVAAFGADLAAQLGGMDAGPGSAR
ncbi:MAG TPA: hypothetical protein VG432_01965 [Gemmatimonadaceae bacterium]|nr:hypothetical protein [Gemmatimonadaceae bacterium]